MATGTGVAAARSRSNGSESNGAPSVNWQYSHPILAEEVDEIVTALGYENNPKGNTAFGGLWGASEQTVRRWRNGRVRLDHGGGFRLGAYMIAKSLDPDGKLERKLRTIFNRHRPK